jgi:flagellar hook-length control protein FliK
VSALSTRTSSALAAPTRSKVVATPAAVATSAAPDRPPTAETNASRRFAELLRAHRSERAAAPARAPSTTAPTAAAPSDRRDAADAGEAETGASPTAPAAAPTTAKARANAAKGATGKPNLDHAPVAESTARDCGDKADDPALPAPTASDERAASSATLAAANAAQRAADPALALPATRAEAETGAGRRIDQSPTVTGREAAQGGAVHGRGAAVVDTDIARPERETAIVQSLHAAGDASFQATLGEVAHVATDRPTASNVADAAAASISAAGAIRGSSEPAGIVATPTALALTTPIDAPEFAAALGIQVSLLAQDGVQHAELHLNPAETGPVSIHIAVDGTTARVDFGADLAATRHAIEHGLPELASALRDAGLTLTGGGVSQHAGSREHADDHAPGPREARSAIAAVPIAPPVRSARIAAGGVDLYA